MADLCTIDDVAAYTGVDYDPSAGSSIVDQINFLIPAISDNIRKICNRQLTATDTNKNYDMDGKEVTLIDYPIISVTEVSYGSPFGTTARTVVDSTEYITYDDIGIIGLQFNIRKSKQWVNVQARLGHEIVPDALNLIATKEVVRSLNETGIDTNLKNEKLGDASWSYVTTSDSQKALTMELSPWIKSVGI